MIQNEAATTEEIVESFLKEVVPSCVVLFIWFCSKTLLPTCLFFYSVGVFQKGLDCLAFFVMAYKFMVFFVGIIISFLLKTSEETNEATSFASASAQQSPRLFHTLEVKYSRKQRWRAFQTKPTRHSDSYSWHSYHLKNPSAWFCEENYISPTHTSKNQPELGSRCCGCKRGN